MIIQVTHRPMYGKDAFIEVAFVVDDGCGLVLKEHKAQCFDGIAEAAACLKTVETLLSSIEQRIDEIKIIRIGG